MAIAYYRLMKGYDFSQPFNSQFNQQHVKFWSEFEGVCIKSFVKNDDLYMVVFDKESNSFKKVKYASNGNWSYSKHSSFVDAPYELVQKYNQFKLDQQRKKKALELIELRRSELKAVGKHNISIKNLRKILSNHGLMYYNKCLSILNAIVRSSAKKGLKTILLSYINNDLNKVAPFTYSQWRLVQQLF